MVLTPLGMVHWAVKSATHLFQPSQKHRRSQSTRSAKPAKSAKTNLKSRLSLTISRRPGFILPDLVGHCTYPLHLNPNWYAVSRQSEQWLLKDANFSEKKRSVFLGLKAGELTSACYPNADPFCLQVTADFMGYLFTLDDWSDDFSIDDTYGLAECVMNALRDPVGFQTDKAAGILAKDFFGRYVSRGGPGCTERFIHTMDLFFKAVSQQARDRANGVVPELESYIEVRRDTSGCKPCFALIEFCADIDLPQEVVSHPMIQALEEATNDLVTWSNDIFSYNVEQARGDTHNMISVFMQTQGLDLQSAVDAVGDFCKQSIDRFEANRATLPSWGPDVDRDVQIYVQGLQDWIVGSLHWSFDTTRYFGQEGAAIKKHRSIKLLPLRQA
ncbi:isoprenoid synthase domain-containing protein [Cristinia sonorae]|uniref:Terpene synthase n=1 Tax=Cristinia sonorae TaxID=1940300 RepID=A0A8K0UNA2_9AGAR|nr:isoprenoid synthase domain-containing protein [Cristinia sonorae]